MQEGIQPIQKQKKENFLPGFKSYQIVLERFRLVFLVEFINFILLPNLDKEMKKIGNSFQTKQKIK